MPFGPGGKHTYTEDTEWLPGGFFLLMHWEEKGLPEGEAKGLGVMGYNAAENVYTHHSFDGWGRTYSQKGTVEGDTLTWTSEGKRDGKPVKSRFIIKKLSPTSFSYKSETSTDGRTWSTIMEGKSTKTK